MTERSPIPRTAAITGLVGGAILAGWLTTRTADGGLALPGLALALGARLPVAAVWLLMAFGFGRPLSRWLDPGGRGGAALQLGLGVAAALTLDAALGSIGFFGFAGPIGAWLLVAGGAAIAIEQLRRWRPGPVAPAAWVATPAAVVLLVAACSAPGWLWASEFGGYDALSYHLQLPREWLAGGVIRPLEHNVYSGLPGSMEAAYLHLALLVGDDISFATAAQLLHAMLAVATAIVTARVAATIAPGAASPAGIALLGIPWIVVVGSLAYNEMAVAFMLACGLLAVFTLTSCPRRGLAIGLLAGVACGAKLTSVGFVAIPLVVLLLGRTPARGWPLNLLAGAAGGLTALAPWLIRNTMVTGNPVFPFATELLGTAHWSSEQAAAWWRGHQAAGGPVDRLGVMVVEIVRYGLGPAPGAEPWKPQWSIAPLLLPVAAAITLARRAWRRPATELLIVVGIQVVFWLALTHLKSRFFVPAAVPIAVLLGLAITAAGDRLRTLAPRGAVVAIGVIVGLAWSFVPLPIFLGERGGAPAQAIGQEAVFSGEAYARALRRPGLSPQQREAVMEGAPPGYWVNHELGKRARVLLVGEGRPFYLDTGTVYQTTWDRGPFSAAMRAHPDDPRAWLDALRDEGFTHVLINAEMLDNWSQRGWGDPLLTPERVVDAVTEHAIMVRRFGPGLALYELR